MEKEWRENGEIWGGNRLEGADQSPTSVIDWQSQRKGAPMMMTHTKPQDLSKSRLLQSELDKWEPALTKPQQGPVQTVGEEPR